MSETAGTVYGIRAVSHYQGSRPGPVLTTGTKAEMEEIQDKLSTCSFCDPGRAAQYSTGECYEVVRTSRPMGYVHEDAGPAIREALTGLAE